MITRSRSTATHVMAPGASSDALVTGTNPSSAVSSPSLKRW